MGIYYLGLANFLIVAGVIWLIRARVRQRHFSADPQAVAVARLAYTDAQINLKGAVSRLHGVDDPVLAAVILLVALVRVKGAVTTSDEKEIDVFLHYVVRQPLQPEVLAFANWACDGERDVRRTIDQLQQIWMLKLSIRERRELCAMAKRICTHRSMPNEKQLEAIKYLKHSLGVRS